MWTISLVLLVQCLYMLVPDVSSNLAESLERYGLHDTRKYQQDCGDISQLQLHECYFRKVSDVTCFNVSIRYDKCKSIDITADHDDVSSADQSTKSWQALKAFHNRHNASRRRHMYFDGECVEMDEGKCSLYQCEKDCCPPWKRDFSGQCSIRKGMDYCENGGSYNWNKSVCSCPYGYSGSKCEIPICEPGCYNNGVCVTSLTGQRTCSCPQFTTGKHCEHVICKDRCEHGECIVDGLTPVCLCDPGYYGKTCQHASKHDSACPVPMYPMCSSQNLNCIDGCTMDSHCGFGDVCCYDGCCSSCMKPIFQRCFHDGKLYRPRQSFQKDKCTTCLCLTSGTMSCNRKSCPVLNCIETEHLPAECCPRCKDTTNKHVDSLSPTIIMDCSPNTPKPVPVRNNNYADMSDLNIVASDRYGTLKVRYSPPRLRHCQCLDKDVTYIEVSAMDGNKTVATCQQPVIVVDVQSPAFLLCPGFIDVHEGEPAYWREPFATDNVGIVTLESNFARGSVFTTSAMIIYIATDYDRNRALCSFNVYVSYGYENNLNDYDSSVKTTTSFVGMIVGVVVPLIMVIIIILAIIYRRNRLKHSHYRQNNRPSTRQQQNRCQRRPQNLPINTISNQIYGEMLSRDGGRINTIDFTPLPPPYSPATNPPSYEELLQQQQQQQVDNDIKPPDYDMVISQDRDGISV